MVDSWEDLDEGALDDELEVLQSMYPDEYEKLAERRFSLRLTAECTSGKAPCVFECEVPEDYPATAPVCSVSIDLKDHLTQKQLERACEAHLRTFAESQTGAACLTGLADALVEAMRDPHALTAADEDVISTACSTNVMAEGGSMTITPTEDPFDVDDKEPPPGEVVRTDAKYESRSGMQGFSAKTFVFTNSELGYRTADGSCVTMGNPKSRHAKWGLLGDGPLSFAELEVGKVRAGHNIELLLGVTASSPKKVDFQWLHQTADTLLVALDCRAPRTSLGYRDGELFPLSNDVPKKGAPLKPGDRLGVWYSCGELRILQNSKPLLRVRADLGKQVTLMVLLMGRVVQLQMHVPETVPKMSFEGLDIQGCEKALFGKWLESDDCTRLRPLW